VKDLLYLPFDIGAKRRSIDSAAASHLLVQKRHALSTAAQSSPESDAPQAQSPGMANP
jgi:hypothetical protein